MGRINKTPLPVILREISKVKTICINSQQATKINNYNYWLYDLIDELNKTKGFKYGKLYKWINYD